MRRWAAYLWAGPVTLVGLAVALLALAGGRIALVGGVVEARGPLIRWGLRRLIPLKGGAAALTLGHVVLGASAQALELTRAHERAHVRQYERWGALFPIAYLLAGAWALVVGRHVYFDNHFESEARARAAVSHRREDPDLDSGRHADRAQS